MDNFLASDGNRRLRHLRGLISAACCLCCLLGFWEAAGEVCSYSSETSHGLGHFSYPRVQHSSHPTFLAPSRPRTPETAQCGLSVGNKCDWNPKKGTGNQGVMWRVWDVRVVSFLSVCNKNYSVLFGVSTEYDYLCIKITEYDGSIS